MINRAAVSLLNPSLRRSYWYCIARDTMAPKRKRASPSTEFKALLKTNGERERAVSPVIPTGHQGPVSENAAANICTGETAIGKDATQPTRRKRGVSATKVPPGPVFEHSMRPAPLQGSGYRIMSWNVAGLRALLKEEKNVNLGALADEHGVDVMCLQEIKLQEGAQCKEVWSKLQMPGWHVAWNCSKAKKGYSGTAIMSREKPLSVSCGIGHQMHDEEGRVITIEFSSFYIVNAYVPNSGDGLKRLDYRINEWDKDFSSYLAGLSKNKGVVLAGDLNCAHKEIDIHNPKGNLRSAGFTQEERESFSSHLLGAGFVDAFRQQYPGVVGYTYWGYRFNMRSKNAGWRLDYFLVSESLWDMVHECYHLPEVLGSDHCPLMLVMKTGA